MIRHDLTACYLLKQQPLSKSFLNALHIYIVPIRKLSENTSQIHIIIIIIMFVKFNAARLKMVYLLLQSLIKC